MHSFVYLRCSIYMEICCIYMHTLRMAGAVGAVRRAP